MNSSVTGIRALLSTPNPSVGLEIAADRVTAVALSWSHGCPVVAAWASTVLPEGTIVPSVNALNIMEHSAVTDAISLVFNQLPYRPSRVAVIVPDSAAKVSLVRFEQVPARMPDLDELIRWQVQKSAPFRLQDAQVSSTPGITTQDGSQEFIVALMRRDVVQEYEDVCDAAGAQAGVLDLASFNLINLSLVSFDPGDGDWLLVHVAPGYNTLAIVRGKTLIFFRNRPAEGNDSLLNLAHQTAMYYQDRLEGNEFSHAQLLRHSGLDDGVESAELLQHTLGDRIGVPVRPLNTSVVTPQSASTDLGVLAAPIGLLLRERSNYS